MVQQKIENLVAPMQQVLSNFNTKDKSSATVGCISCELDASLASWMHQSAAFFVFLTQLRAMRALITNPEQYVSKLVNDEPPAIQFKNDKTIAALQ